MKATLGTDEKGKRTVMLQEDAGLFSITPSTDGDTIIPIARARALHEALSGVIKAADDLNYATRPPGYPATPELDKQHHALSKAQTVSEFLDWLDEVGKAVVIPDNGLSYRSINNREQLIAEFLDINYPALQKERDAVFRYVQKQANKGTSK